MQDNISNEEKGKRFLESRKVFPDKIPSELKSINRWVGWVGKPAAGFKLDKIPINPRSDKAAAVNDPQSWGTFEQSMEWHNRKIQDRSFIGGVGFIFRDSDDYCGIDLDHCREPKSGTLQSQFLTLLNKINSYTEISPSLEGVKVFCSASLSQSVKKDQIEIYSKGRFFTVTGRRIDNWSPRVEKRGEALQSLIKKLCGDNGGPKEGHSEQQKGWHDDILQGVGESERHAAALKLAARWSRKGLSDSEMAQILCLWNARNRPPKPSLSDPQSKEMIDILSYVRGAESKIEWSQPVPLESFTGPQIDPESVPGVIGEISKAISAATETPYELPLGMGLAVAAAACQGRFAVEVKPGYAEPLSIFVNTVLESGSRKSSVADMISLPFKQWEQSRREAMAGEIMRARSKRENLESRIKSLRVRYGKSKQDELPDIENEILSLESELEEVPRPPQLWCGGNVTAESLAVLMAQNHERMAVLSAEGELFEILAGRYSGGVPNFDLYLSGHAGEGVRVNRIGREPVFLERPSLSIGISVQPYVLQSLSKVPGFRGKGLLARFLYLLPQSTVGKRNGDGPPVPPEVMEQYARMIHVLLDVPPSKDQSGKPVPHILKLSKSAYQAWYEFYTHVEREMADGGRFESLRDWCGKLPGAAARIAGVIHCSIILNESSHVPIDESVMGAALELASLLADHAEVAFRLMGCIPYMGEAKRILRWIKVQPGPSFTKREVFQALKGSFPRVADLEEPIAVLEERGYIASSKRQPEGGGRPSVDYHVNPFLRAES